MKNKLTKLLTLCMLLCLSLCAFTACSHEHSYTTSVTAPTCTEKGFTTYTCECGETYIDNYVEKLGHDFTDYISDNNANYDNDGTKTATCNRDNCSATDTITESGTKLISHIEFKTLDLENKNIFANNVEEFAFLEEIETFGYSTFSVANDKYGKDVYLTKTVPLGLGDNTFYVFESIDGDIVNTFTIVLRRRPTYRVQFNTKGGTEIQSQTIEESFTASIPTEKTEKAGYTFDGWDYDFTTPITESITIDAKWEANTDTPYTVEYYFEKLDGGYEIDNNLTEELVGTTDTTATVTPQEIDYFTYSSMDSVIIAGDGGAVLRVFYTRNTYTVTFNGNGGELFWGEEMQTVKYGDTVIAPAYKKKGYHITGWDKALTNISDSTTITAIWKDGYTRYGNYIEIGSYPQTIKEQSVTVSITANEQGYFVGSDGELYVKIIAALADKDWWDYYFSDDTRINEGDTYYFKVEPIRWRILKENDGNALLLCDNIIENKRFDDDSNNYKQSEIRQWLNNEFLNSAFTAEERAFIKTVTVDNSVESTGFNKEDFEYEYSCEDTQDKVFLLSYKEVTNIRYGFFPGREASASRQMLASDYTRATGVGLAYDYYYRGKGCWMLRSPDKDNNGSLLIGYEGDVIDRMFDSVTDNGGGIVPALQILL